jgi:hypothetical protein
VCYFGKTKARLPNQEVERFCLVFICSFLHLRVIVSGLTAVLSTKLCRVSAMLQSVDRVS